MRNPLTTRGIVLALLLAAAAPMLSACNTTAGAGKDVSAVGQGVTRGANQVKQGL